MGKKLFGVSTLTMIGLYAMLSVIILALCIVMNVSILIGLGVSIVILIIQFLISPFLTDLTMKWFYKIDYNANLPEYLESFIASICSKYGMKRPKIGLINDGAPNAFTYGRGKNDARVVLTRGIFELLDEDEVKAVVAHEFGHIVHYDMLFMTVAQLVPLVCYFVYQMFLESDNSSNNNKNGAIIGAVAFALYIISEYIVLWLSRTREYFADEFSLEETQNPNSLASALVKIGFGLSVPSVDEGFDDKKKKKQRSAKDVGALGIFDSKTSKSLVVASGNDMNNKSVIKNAMKWEMWNPWAIWYQLNSTHPLVSKRLIAISNRSKDFGQEPYISFDYKKPESYMDDFVFELLIAFLPSLIFILTVVLAIVLGSNNNKMLFLISGCGLLLVVLTSFIKFKRRHKSGYTKTNVANLLSEIKVSDITAIPCVLEGNIIGKGDPGCIFSEDFIIQDETGIIFLDYNQPMFIINKVFALFKSHKYIDKKIKVKGWYRRSPVPYVEIYEYEIDGTVKKVYTYVVSLILYVLLTVIGILLIFVGM